MRNNAPLRSYTTDDVSLQLRESANKPNNIILISQLKKLWVMLEEINAAICADSMTFVINNKPIFDEQKCTLIAIQNYAELCLETGNIRSMRARGSYQGNSLAADTFSADWNVLAKSVNDLISEINFDTSVDNARDTLNGYVWQTNIGPSSSNALTRFIPRNTTFLGIVCILTLIGISTLVGLTVQEYRYLSDQGETTTSGNDIALSSSVADTTMSVDTAKGQPDNSKSALGQLNANSKFTYVDAKLHRGPVRYESGKMNYRGEYMFANGDSAKNFYEEIELRSEDGKYRIANGKGTNCFPIKSRCYEGSFKDGKPHGKGTFYDTILGTFPGFNGNKDVSNSIAKKESNAVKRYGMFYGYTDSDYRKGKLFNWEGLTLYSGEMDTCFTPVGTAGAYNIYNNRGSLVSTISQIHFQGNFTASSGDFSNFYWFLDPVWKKACKK